MFTNQYPYSIFNQDALNEFARRQRQNQEMQKHHMEQQKNILDIRKAIRDYCDAARKVSPYYQQEVIYACMEEIMLQAMKDGINARQ